MAIEDLSEVKKVRDALRAAGLADRVVELKKPLADVAAAAKQLEVEPGQIVQTAMYAIGARMVLVILAGDHEVVRESLAPAFFLTGEVREPQAGEIKGLTGYAADSLPPVGFRHKLPVAIDRSLKRFKHVYASAGDPKAVFRTSVDDLKRLTEGIVSWNVAKPVGADAPIPPMRRNKTFTGARKVPGLDDAGDTGTGTGGG